MLAGLELRPTSALFSSTRSRQVSVSSRHRPPVPRRRAPRSAGTPERRGLCKPSLQAALSAWACHTGAAPGCRDPPRAWSAPAYARAPAGIGRRAALARPAARAFCPAQARGDLVPREAPYAARVAPMPTLARGAIRRSLC